MEKRILELLNNSSKKKINITVISDKLNAPVDQVLEVLKQMDENNQIAIDKDMDIYLIDQKTYFKGIVHLNAKGFGFVSNLDNSGEEHDDFFVPPVNLNGAINLDTVVYEVVEDVRKNRDSGEEEKSLKANILKITNREKEYIVGTIQRSWDGRFLDFITNDQAFASFRFVMVNKRDIDLKENMIVKAKVIRSEKRKVFIRVIKVVGDANKAADRILSIAEEFNVRTEFNINTLNNAKEVGIDAKDLPDELKRREKNSIQDRCMVTIDGIHSKDLDDSICVEKLPNNQGYRLLVGIADVSYYVQPKSALDNEALMRGNSTYLANVVLPMLPEILSNGVCSLNPGEIKLAMCCEMTFNNNGDMTSKKAYETTLISKARLNYDQVNKYFETGEIDVPKEVADMLTVARELHHILNDERERRGTIDFEIREPEIVMDKDSNVIGIESKHTGEAERLIENFMVSANEAVATLIYEKELPFVYRNHGKPSEEKLDTWYAGLKNFGIDVKLTEEQKQDPKNINKTLMQIDSQITDPIEKELLNVTLLRYMEKAKYGLENIGHFGLASQCYTHFTSPIRRYSDLMVHRYLKEYLVEHQTDERTLESNTKFIEKACSIINDTEQNSVDTEREVNKVCMVEYMKDKIGNIYDGVISVALKFGTFVQLDNLVEGLVHISQFPEGTVFDEKMGTLTTPQNKIYRLGQKVKIKVVKADIQTRKIDFEFVE